VSVMKKFIHTREHKEFCNLLVETRKQYGLTQVELAKRLKSSQSFVSKYERGERRLDVLEFIQIAKDIGADPAELIKKLI